MRRPSSSTFGFSSSCYTTLRVVFVITSGSFVDDFFIRFLCLIIYYINHRRVFLYTRIIYNMRVLRCIPIYTVVAGFFFLSFYAFFSVTFRSCVANLRKAFMYNIPKNTNLTELNWVTRFYFRPAGWTTSDKFFFTLDRVSLIAFGRLSKRYTNIIGLFLSIPII